ncbi:MAG: M48 family metalloprotease [Pseudomonadota bacterium]
MSSRIARRVSCAAMAALLLATTAHSQLPTLGDGNDMSVTAERKLGDKIARELFRDPDYLDDPVLDEYILGIWTRLLAAARARGDLSSELDTYAWQVVLGKDRVINAFALPGGWMGLQLGLVNVSASSDEIAAVLAHELSHVTQRHIARMSTQQAKQLPLLIAGMILGAIAMGKNPEAGNAVLAGGQAAAAQSGLNFSREMEREADRIGFGVMTQAGYDPLAFVTMFEKLQQASRLSDNGNFPYLRTHPMTTERIAEAQSRQQLAARPATAAAPDLVHAIMVARSRVLSNPGVDGLRAYAGEADGPQATGADRTRQVATLYAAAFASAKLRDIPSATRIAARLTTATANDANAARFTKLLNAEIAFMAGDFARAASLVDIAGATRPELMLGARARIQGGRAPEAVQRLQTWVAVHPRDAEGWQLLGQAYNAQGDALRAIRAEAEAQVAHLDYQAAIDRFKAAQDVARKGGRGSDHIEASIIDTRTRAVQSLLREQALER